MLSLTDHDIFLKNHTPNQLQNKLSILKTTTSAHTLPYLIEKGCPQN